MQTIHTQYCMGKHGNTKCNTAAEYEALQPKHTLCFHALMHRCWMLLLPRSNILLHELHHVIRRELSMPHLPGKLLLLASQGQAVPA